jgi:hypothetical protein
VKRATSHEKSNGSSNVLICGSKAESGRPTTSWTSKIENQGFSNTTDGEILLGGIRDGSGGDIRVSNIVAARDHIGVVRGKSVSATMSISDLAVEKKRCVKLMGFLNWWQDV